MTEKMIEMLVASLTTKGQERNQLVLREALRALARLADSEHYASSSPRAAEGTMAELNRKGFCYAN